jgi:hypothetical protein
MFEASLGPAQHQENLTIFPVLADKDRELPYGLMAGALSMGILTIREKDGGQVPLLLATNTGIHPILILDGEQLIGAKQNRMTNRSIILAPNSITEIPVSCMEQGRWHFEGDHFAPAPQHAPTKVRRKARETEAKASYAAEARAPGARSSHHDLSSAQGEVWDEIRTFGNKLGGTSATGALDSIFLGRREEMKSWKKAFPLLPGQIGLLAVIGKAILGMDALGSPSLYGKVHDRILTGYLLDAMEGRTGQRADRTGPIREDRIQPTPQPTPIVQAQRFIDEVTNAGRTPSDSVGMGDYRVLRGTVLGGELVNDGHLVHLSAFPTLPDRQAGSGPSQTGQSGPRAPKAGPIARPSRRKRRF